MKLKMLALVPMATAAVGFASIAQAQWSTSFTDLGVQYTLSDLGGSATNHEFLLLLNTTGYNHHPAPAYLDSVDIKAWTGTNLSFSLASAPGGTTWFGSEGPISGGSVTDAGCGTQGAGFACVEANTKGVLNVLSGNPYEFRFSVTLGSGSFLASAVGAHIGAGYADALGNGSSYGITSFTSPIPEPETYAMLLAGLGLMGFVVWRRQRNPAAA